MKILVADDDAVSLCLLRKTLERAGYEVICARNGQMASENLCCAEGPRLALLDWDMPLLDGPSVCRLVRKRRSDRYVHIVLLTSRTSKEDTVRGLESGADDYLIKPFHPEELKARLRAALRILRLEDKLLEARDEMRYKATHDSLTSLLNRGVILELLARELARAESNGTCTAVLLGDLDHFKRVNDTCGHVVGDEVLREVGRRLIESVRSYDYVGRYGGEEFLVVLSNCEGSKAIERAEEIRAAIADSPVTASCGPIGVTMSIGIFAAPNAPALEEVLREADGALYAAKAAGRNRICLAANVVA